VYTVAEIKEELLICSYLWLPLATLTKDIARTFIYLDGNSYLVLQLDGQNVLPCRLVYSNSDDLIPKYNDAVTQFIYIDIVIKQSFCCHWRKDLNSSNEMW